MHGSFMHILMNMFMLWMFGMVMENVWGPKKFLLYYIVTGIGAGLCQELAQYANYMAEGLNRYQYLATEMGRIPMENYLNLWTTVGASGAVYGVLLAFGLTFPNERMFIIPIPIPLKAKMDYYGFYCHGAFLCNEYYQRWSCTLSTSRRYAIWILTYSLLA